MKPQRLQVLRRLLLPILALAFLAIPLAYANRPDRRVVRKAELRLLGKAGQDSVPCMIGSSPMNREAAVGFANRRSRAVLVMMPTFLKGTTGQTNWDFTSSIGQGALRLQANEQSFELFARSNGVKFLAGASSMSFDCRTGLRLTSNKGTVSFSATAGAVGIEISDACHDPLFATPKGHMPK